MSTAAIYVRVSTSRQAEADLSLPDQVAQCKRFCEQRGWEVAEVFTEPGASALDDERPVFQEMIYKATRPDHPFDFVVIHSLSRFSRDSFHSELYIRRLRKAGVELISIGQDENGEFMRKMLNVMDERQSRENAKHVHRAMLENARQGFWNGSRPPFGYRVEIVDRRGTRDKKVLVIDEDEARLIRLIFDLSTGVNGRPLGIKAIATHLNERFITRRGQRFSTGSIYKLLTSTTYYGKHHFNRTDSRNKRARPPSEWIAFKVPAIIDEQTFNTVQGLLQSRSPKRVAPRIVNGPTLLAGIARCGHCGSGLVLNTGKGGTYRYYCCSRKMREGAMACEGLRIRMDRLDAIVLNEVSGQVLNPERLHQLLDAYIRSDSERVDQQRQRISHMRQDHKETEAAITRLLTLVEKGLMDADDPSMRERLIGLKLKRDELAADIADMTSRAADGTPTINREKIEKFASLLRHKLNNGPPELKQAYARLVMTEVTVRDKEIRIKGSRRMLAKAASQGIAGKSPAVLSFVREWYAQGESNPCFRRERAAS